MTTDLSRVYTVRKADIIAVFLKAFFCSHDRKKPVKNSREHSFPLVCSATVYNRKQQFSLGISHSICIDGKHSFSFRKTRRVIDFADSGFLFLSGTVCGKDTDQSTKIIIKKILFLIYLW